MKSRNDCKPGRRVSLMSIRLSPVQSCPAALAENAVHRRILRLNLPGKMSQPVEQGWLIIALRASDRCPPASAASSRSACPAPGQRHVELPPAAPNCRRYVSISKPLDPGDQARVASGSSANPATAGFSE